MSLSFCFPFGFEYLYHSKMSTGHKRFLSSGEMKLFIIGCLCCSVHQPRTRPYCAGLSANREKQMVPTLESSCSESTGLVIRHNIEQ